MGFACYTTGQHVGWEEAFWVSLSLSLSLLVSCNAYICVDASSGAVCGCQHVPATGCERETARCSNAHFVRTDAQAWARGAQLHEPSPEPYACPRLGTPIPLPCRAAPAPDVPGGAGASGFVGNGTAGSVLFLGAGKVRTFYGRFGSRL